MLIIYWKGLDETKANMNTVVWPDVFLTSIYHTVIRVFPMDHQGNIYDIHPRALAPIKGQVLGPGEKLKLGPALLPKPTFAP